MASSNKNKKVDKSFVISAYMDYVLEQDHFPSSIYKFCKDTKIKEEEFYQFFGSFETIKQEVWNSFFLNTLSVLNKSKEYSDFSSKERMLTFFFTFFELLTMNRSYVLFSLKEHKIQLKNLKALKSLRGHIKDFATELIQMDNDEKTYKITKNPVAIFSEGAWIQFLFLLNFWVEDDSAGFEKTDMAIEKSVQTIFDLFDNTPLTNVLDFGKFIWNEKSMWN